MNTLLVEIIYFMLPLIVMGLITRCAFNVDLNTMLPSAIIFLLFIVLVLCSTLTTKKFETQLYVFFCSIQLVVLAGSIFFMSKQEIVWKHFFISLPFQLFYWLVLFYYGGIHFTHKF